MVTEVKFEQPLNTPYSIFVIDEGITTEVRLVQPENAEPPIEVTDEGIVISLKPTQS
jgi:hypothetical protein